MYDDEIWYLKKNTSRSGNVELLKKVIKRGLERGLSIVDIMREMPEEMEDSLGPALIEIMTGCAFTEEELGDYEFLGPIGGLGAFFCLITSEMLPYSFVAHIVGSSAGMGTGTSVASVYLRHIIPQFLNKVGSAISAIGEYAYILTKSQYLRVLIGGPGEAMISTSRWLTGKTSTRLFGTAIRAGKIARILNPIGIGLLFIEACYFIYTHQSNDPECRRVYSEEFKATHIWFYFSVNPKW